MNLSDYVAHLETLGRSQNTIAAYCSDLRDFEPTWAGLRRYLDALATFKPSTRQRRVASARSYCAWLGGPPGWDAVLVPLPPGERAPSAPPDAAAVGRLLQAVRGASPLALRDQALLALLVEVGCRVSELVEADIGDVNLPSATARLGLGRRDGRWREAPLGARTQATLADYLAHGRPAMPIGATSALFVNHRGERLTRQGIHLLLRRWSARAGIEPLTPSALRRACAARLLAEQSDEESIRHLMGYAANTALPASRRAA